MKIVINPQYKNLSHFVHELPQNFDNTGKVLHQGRNQVKAFQVEGYNIVVKRYKRPNLIQRVIYTFFRPSKACRAYNFAFQIQNLGINTPEAIAYIEINRHGLFSDSYFVSLQCEDAPLHIVELHKRGFFHGDLNLANILYREDNGSTYFTFIDTNRSHFIKQPSQKTCLKNLMRVTHRTDLLRDIVQTYAQQRGWNANLCCEEVEAMLHHFERKRARKYQIKKVLNLTR